jgi:FkbM family methyltransferase
MPNPPRKLAFVTASTEHGMMIVNRMDRRISGPNQGIGVGFQLLEQGAYDLDEVTLLVHLLDLRRQNNGDGVVAIDCGANIGVHTIEWSRHMTGWGVVMAIEAQERVYYALAGNIAINNCFNAHAMHAAVTRQPGVMKIPSPNYLAEGSFGSLELRKRDNTEFIGQAIDYSEAKMVEVRAVSLDSILSSMRVDLIKIDVEGMEFDALLGGMNCIAAQRPLLWIESVKSDKNQLRDWLEERGYTVIDTGMNFLAIHQTDKCLGQIKLGGAPTLS